MIKMVYKFEWKNKTYPVSAQEAGEYLHSICEQENQVTAERVLELSRDQDAILHPCFEWDDTKAAEKFRLTQARQIISSIVTVIEEDGSEEPVRAFVSVSSTEHSEKGIFKPVITALSNAEDREIVIKNALRDFQILEEKYHHLQELSKVFNAINELINDK